MLSPRHPGLVEWRLNTNLGMNAGGVVCKSRGIVSRLCSCIAMTSLWGGERNEIFYGGLDGRHTHGWRILKLILLLFYYS